MKKRTESTGSEANKMGRRKFLGNSSAAFLGMGVTGISTLKAMENQPVGMHSSDHSGLFQERGFEAMVQKAIQYKKIDAHNHTGNFPDMIESMDRVGIQWAAISDLQGKNTPENFRKSNDVVLKAVKQYPGRFLGKCRINPGYTKEALEEIDRCVDQGMVMLGELYDEYKANDPVYYPIIERCIDHKVPILIHSANILGLWREGYPKVGSSINTSIADHFVDIGKRYPEALIICGHIGGGGDWEYVCRVLRNAPTVYLDTSGSVSDEGMIDMAVEHLGVDRLLFATDVNYETGVGKIMSANLTEKERKKIFFENFNNLLKPAGNHVN
ncbi:amidohydrolase family protein [Flagellimonas olearia]|uniref:Amidohydrolase family protein n=1 Tax=Flagellimonas olearia TaxID=552546 RepID=A0A6I1DXU7_9FLAO|nr:amidohydrolase family protein [Allomuricauda olearia]KAB7530098.1 amidohydrolase family protein [Allomuricauda olearia]